MTKRALARTYERRREMLPAYRGEGEGGLAPLAAFRHHVRRGVCAVSESSVVRYAVVGLGRAGWGIHVHQLRGRADSRIVAVVDPVEERRDEAVAEFQCRAYPSLVL